MSTDPMIQFDHILKLRRAREHLEGLNSEIVRWLEEKHYEISVKPDVEWPSYSAIFIRGEETPTYPTSLMLGECLHNLRSALDYLAYELAVTHTNPLPQNIAESSEFPIFGDESKNGKGGMGAAIFRDKGRAKIRGVDPLSQAEIERLQPYQRGTEFATHPLWILHELDRISKHRLLHTVADFSKGLRLPPDMAQRILDHAQITPSPGVGQAPPPGTARYRTGLGCWEITGGIVTEHDTRFFRLAIPSDITEDEVKMKLGTAMGVAFRNVTFDAKPQFVLETLDSIYNFIITEVVPKLEAYL